MELIKNNMSYVLKLFINHVVCGISSLILFIFLTVAAEGRYVVFGSAFSILFYLSLLYSFMWEAGAKRAVGHNNRKIKVTDGAVINCVASAPFYLTTVLTFILSFFTTQAEFAEKTVDVLYNAFYYFNVFFSQCMYSGLFSRAFDGIPNVSSFYYLLSILPAIIVASSAYYLGSKNFRIRRLLGIKYDEEKEKIKNNY